MIGLINMFLYLLWFWVLNCPDIVMPWYCNFSNRQKFGSKISHLKTPPTYPEIPLKVKSRHCSYKMLWILKHTSKWFQFTCGIVACQEANPLKEQASPWSLHYAGKDFLHFKICQHPSKIESVQNWIRPKLNPSKIVSIQYWIHPKLNPSNIESIQSWIYPKLNPSKIESIQNWIHPK